METKKDKIKSLSREQLAGLITKSKDSKKGILRGSPEPRMRSASPFHSKDNGLWSSS